MTPTQLFRQKTVSVGSSPRAHNKFAKEISVENDLQRWGDWAKKRLRSAGLPASWKARKTVDGVTFRVLSRVPVDTIEEYAASVLLHAEAAAGDLKAGRAQEAAWHTARACEAFWVAFIEGVLAAPFISAQKQQAGSKKGQAARRVRTQPRLERLRQFFAENPGDARAAIQKASKEFGIKPDTIRRRYLKKISTGQPDERPD